LDGDATRSMLRQRLPGTSKEAESS